ncbi:PREDICTED: leucine-rich repeat-containing protein 3B isoform X2 [Hipposideros armiger]|uniref:Leucine-rich repeat-containing protein 3B isoform X2 n=1 Tax=Hipposideros armiger TaxID=186990 RepID=A0A8B7QJR5_HIPAR|nr:PREDICTED: leucine-rich repeat-containing protein 3B isoform X2 [Hipposideros armiger]
MQAGLEKGHVRIQQDTAICNRRTETSPNIDHAGSLILDFQSPELSVPHPPCLLLHLNSQETQVIAGILISIPSLKPQPLPLPLLLPNQKHGGEARPRPEVPKQGQE